MRSSIVALAVTGLLLVVGAGGAAAQSQDKTKLPAEREALMKDNGRDWVVIRNYVQGKADQAAALTAVDALSKRLPTVPDYFPPGSAGPNPDGKYGPKPEVFSERDKFVAADKKVAEQVAAVGAAIKSGDKPKLDAAFKELGFCVACHDTFRAKLQ